MSNELHNRRLSALRTAIAPIMPFLNDDAVVEIMLNADGTVWVEKVGVGMYETDVAMSDDDALSMLRFIAAETSTELNVDEPSLSAELPFWGARVQAAIPPIVKRPIFAIRKPPKIVFSIDDYVAKGILSPSQREALVDAVNGRANILVGGGTGSGKTTFANALLKVVSDSEDRIFIVENVRELQCTARNRVEFLINDSFNWRQAIMAAMRLRPDRIVVGEVRDSSALDLIKAWNTGHPGGLATVHANDTPGMLDRICQLIEEVAPSANRRLVAEAINVCVYISRDPRHPAGRSIRAVDRVVGVASDGRWQLEPLAA